MKKLISALSILLMIIFTLTSCKTGTSNASDSKNLMDDIKRNEPNINSEISSEEAEKITDFGLELYKRSLSSEGENTLVSPISVIYALGMTANGADGQTLEEIEDTFNMDVDQINNIAYLYEKSIANNEDIDVSLANSIWINDKESFQVNPDFLQVNKDYYDSSFFLTVFSGSTVDEINKWVKDNTNGMIDKIINKISERAVMYLINAIAFDAGWEEPYSEDQISPGIFTKEDGSTQEVDFMYSDEYFYIEGDNEVGLIKDYKGSSYAFVALLPNEGMAIEDYIGTLSGKEIQDLVNNAEEIDVRASIPKFNSEYEIVLNASLEDMGIKEAFMEEGADFSRITENDTEISISEVRHKTYIDVNEKGTKAAAVTSIAITESAIPVEEEVKYINLDRPFVYMIYDQNNNIPIFIGNLMEI